MDDAALSNRAATVVGCVGGAIGGLLGGGSGVFFVPALDRLTRLPRTVLHGTSTTANIAVCAVGAAVYALAGGAMDLRAGAGLTLGGIIGGVLGANLLARISERVLRLLFIVVVLATAVKLYLDAAGLDPLAGRAAISADLLAEPWFVLPVTVGCGIVIGAWAAALGLGGGLLAVPTLVLLFGADIHTAAGTSLLMFVPNSVAGAVVHLRNRTASARISAWLSLGAVPGTVTGSLIALALDSTVLGVVFGTFALAMGVREVIQYVRHRDSRQTETRPSAASTPVSGRPSWWFPEYQPVGVDLASAESVAAYDARQGTNASADDALLDRLGVGAGTVLVDLACGTGAFAIRAAKRGALVHGVDVSPEMLAHASRRADAAGISVHWHHAGFLDFVHPGPPADVVTTKSALHQLPDLFKQEALLRAAEMVRPGGTFYLWDAIFSFEPTDAETELQRWVDSARDADSFTPEEFETHIREEFSTYDWIIAGMLDRAGFDIVEQDRPRPTHAEFRCIRRNSTQGG